jgi:hypothetical protein
LKELLFTLTSADVGGADALAVNVTGVARPANVAVTVCGLLDPMLSVVVATPVAPVVVWTGLTAPPPDATAQFTTTPGTAQVFASRAVTLKGPGSGLFRYHAAGSPLVFTSCVAAPGMQGPMPPPLPPPRQANTSSPTPSDDRLPQRKNVIAASINQCGSKTSGQYG